MSIYKETAQLLINNYGLSSKFINMLAEERDMSNLLNILERSLTTYEKLELMLRVEGSDFFAGSSQSTKELRKKIIDCWTDDVREDEFMKRCASNGKSERHKTRKLAELNWMRGGAWPRAFMENSGIDQLFSGKKSGTLRYEDYEDVEPYKRLPTLKDYQLHLKDELKKALTELGDDAKCLISLPTGSGKTRIAVEAYTEFLRPRFFAGKYLIWIAQSEELCEQAIVTFQQIWQHMEFTESLRIYRMHGGHRLHEADMCGGVVVCSINKLYQALLKGGSEETRLLIENCGACIIDEAHRAVTMMYNTFYEYSQRIRGRRCSPYAD